MKKNKKNIALAFIAMLLPIYSPHALAYVGPGLGLGMLGTILGFIAGLLLLIVGVVWYPLKKLLRRFRSKNEAEQGQ